MAALFLFLLSVSGFMVMHRDRYKPNHVVNQHADTPANIDLTEPIVPRPIDDSKESSMTSTTDTARACMPSDTLWNVSSIAEEVGGQMADDGRRRADRLLQSTVFIYHRSTMAMRYSLQPITATRSDHGAQW